MYTKGKLRALAYMSPEESWRIADKNGNTLATTGRGKKAKDNAQRLVKTWNEYDELKATNDELVEALEKILKQEKSLAKAMAEIAITDKTRKQWENMESANTKVAKQALAKAERSKE